ncbi:DUF1353 domain-containing protein [Nocardia sp. NBC_01503]|uniref:DUF1353 domain-containing protein n=1 Tax=Nocardia sp. NBC_01503 TaxID=2975997 RepID=UPI002E7AB0EE|nr:DUF1353 domain-containing protein [Nocardia sp. NBC_01503]WTL31163.1 DUF1353 domain-containing protein [Nocardia sp. NBC_01503]
MKLSVEQPGGSFYDAGHAPAEVAADAISPAAVVVNTEPQPAPAPPPEAPAPPVPPLPDLTISLARLYDTASGREEFRLLHRIGYVDDAPGIGVGTIQVPADLEHWTTDLTSVPSFLTWLVPKTGAHLPAAILHDGLVLNKDEPASYIAERVIHRDEADRIFRDAMAKTGTGLIRRWLVWSAVTVATMHEARQVDWTSIQKWHYRIALWGTLGLIVVLGIWGTLDLFDTPGVPSLPWMGDRPLTALVGGLSGALVIPLLLGLTWGKFRIAGWIVGPLIAVIIPAVLPIVLVGWLYVGVEKLHSWHPWLAEALAIVGVVAAFGVFIASWWFA